MATKTIGVTEEVYDRLKARKRADESFTDLLDRLLGETEADWRVGFGSLPDSEGEELEQIVSQVRAEANTAFDERQRRATETLTADDDEAA